jgi:hypothetical protein
MYFKKLILTTFLATGLVHAETSIGIDINNEDIEILGELNFNSLADYSSGTTYILDVGYLYTDSDHLATVGFSGQNTLQGVEGLTLSLGAKLTFAEDFIALPLMVKASYALPLIDTIPTTSLAASFAYAPEVLTFVDGKTYSELRLEADMEIISNIHIFTGYRNIDTDYEYRDYNFNDSFYGGIKISF